MKINNPNWSKEYILAEFVKLNPHIINENQLIQLYNQYLNKYLQEQHQQQIHFKQSKFTQLINEAEEWNKKGKNFDVALSVTKQLPFFCCPNQVLSKESQKAIQRYVYCNETGTQAYSGSYGEQPHKWLQQYFILKQAFAQKEKAQIDGRRKN